MTTFNEALAAGRHVITYGMGFATAIGLVSVSQGGDITSSVDHIFNGLKEIAVGVGPLAGIAMAWWAKRTASPAAQTAAVANLPEVRAIVTEPTPEGRALAEAAPANVKPATR
jgi:hypothetical protein